MRRTLHALAIILMSCNGGEESGIHFNQYAYIRTNSGIVRSDPVYIAPELEILPYGTKIQILNKTENKVRIGSTQDYWYNVRCENHIEGWIYGNSLTFSSGDIKEKDSEKIAMDPEVFRENLTGKWWEIRDDGSTGLAKIYFWKDGKYSHGFGRSEMSEGTYEISSNFVVLDHGSTAGERLEIFEVGEEFRLKGKKKGVTYVFIKGDPDPESPEIGDSEKEETENANTQEGKTN